MREDELLKEVYDELRKVACQILAREKPGHTLQPTDLVHEAYSRMTGQRDIDWANRHHFYGIAAKVMRRVLSDHARRRLAIKRGGASGVVVPLDDVANLLRSSGSMSDPLLVGLDEALTRLSEIFPRQARVVELRFFGGLEEKEIALIVAVSERTVKRDWAFAQAWLREELTK